jgi:hypothetical protein
MLRQNMFILVYSFQVQLEPICFKYRDCNPFWANTLWLGNTFSPLSNLCELCQCLPESSKEVGKLFGRIFYD